MDPFSVHRGDRLLWIAVGAAVTLVVAVAVYRYVGALVSAIFLYYALRPIYRRVDDRVPYSDVSVTLTILFVLVPTSLIVGYALFLIAQELQGVLSGGALSAAEPYAQPYLRLAQTGQFQALADAIADSRAGQEGATGSTLVTVVNGLVGVASLLLGVLAQVFLTSVFLFYLLRDGHLIREWFYDAVDHDDRIVAFIDAVDDDLESVFFNNLVLIVLTAFEATVTYYLLNLLVPGGPIVGSPVLLGALIGIGVMIPVVGMKIVYPTYALYLFVLAATGEMPIWHPIAFLAVSAIVVDTIPDVFIRTYLSARGTIHMGMILLGYVLGTMAFGWYGLFLGPILVVIFFHFAHTAFPWLASSYLGGDGRW